MTPEQTIQELERYRDELIGIKDRFVHGRNSISIKREDDPRYRTIVIELVDLISDSIGKNKYSILIYQIFTEGITNYTQSPSYKSVEDIISVVDSAITWFKRNAEKLNQTEETKNEEIQDTKEISHQITTTKKADFEKPEKVSLGWLWDHVPIRFWVYLVGILFSVFLLGIRFANTKLYKSIIP